MDKYILFLGLTLAVAQFNAAAQNPHEHHQDDSKVSSVEPQPLLAQAMRLKEALDFLGSSLSPQDENHLAQLRQGQLTHATVKQVQEILDAYCLFLVDINPEGRVKVERGAAPAKLMQNGWTSFLVKVNNEVGGTAQLNVESPNALPPQHSSWVTMSDRVHPEHVISPGEVANRFLEVEMYRSRPMQANLSGIQLEYAIVQIYSKDSGKREAEIGFNAGDATQDIGFRNTVHILFDVSKAIKVSLHITGEDGSPSMASVLITDEINRVSGRLSNVYPLPSRRVAASDEYPDFFFQKQVYRNDGEHVMLPPGKFHVTYTRGPEYLPQEMDILVPEGRDSMEVSLKLKRWINLSKLGWYSADHHVHAAGCSHYNSPEEGVRPYDMWRQAVGEDLNISALLSWGPSWYHQKTHFSGKDDPISGKENILRYDVEVSGFPSSHAGHVVLLNLKEDDYPGTTKIEEWPSWTLPIMQWAKSQGSIVGYAHTGHGMAPLEPTNDLPNYILPKLDWIGANEFVLTVAHNAADFYSAGDTPFKYELNMWYHVLNCGFRPRISGETDFPCITDDRIGQGRSYFKISGPLSYEKYIQAIKEGHSYVSDGGSHIINFTVNGLEAGTKNSELNLKGSQIVNITAEVAAYLHEKQDKQDSLIAKTELTKPPYWNIERARISNSRKVGVELIVNGYPADTVEITADGKMNKIKFSYVVKKSVWMALRILGTSHTNPVFIEEKGNQIREKRSVEWCIETLERNWRLREPNIRKEEKEAAREAYDQARIIYSNLLKD